MKQVDFLHQKTKALIAEDWSEAEIIEELKKHNVEEFYARTLINNVLEDERDQRDFWKLFAMGAITTITGLIINYLSYTNAIRAGGLFYYIFWGILVSGIVMLIKAFTLLRK